MEKRYWGPDEYDKAIFTIRYKTPKGQRLPEFSDPETSAVLKKLFDPQNFIVTLSDENLGLSHRNNVAEEYFKEIRDLPKAYSAMDREDKFIYGMELIESYKFLLHLELYYFDLGNQNIIKNSDDPNSTEVKRLLSSNVRTLYKNFNNYLDYVNNESSFSEDELISYSEGLKKYFPMLIEKFPEGNKSIITSKAELMLNKAQNEQLKEALNFAIATFK